MQAMNLDLRYWERKDEENPRTRASKSLSPHWALHTLPLHLLAPLKRDHHPPNRSLLRLLHRLIF